jgi:hypothetical protein
MVFGGFGVKKRMEIVLGLLEGFWKTVHGHFEVRIKVF